MKKILLIDDDEPFCEATKEVLESGGYEVICASDGVKGEQLCRKEKPDLVITDVIMPNEDGLGFLMKIRGDANNYPCKIIVMSGGGRVGARDYLEMARQMDVDDILEKPFGMNTLLNCVEKVLG